MPESVIHSFPKDFAKYLADVWDKVIGGQYTPPTLPNEPGLTALLETAYLAGLETDEARPVRFALCYTSTEVVEGLFPQSAAAECWAFESERPFTVQELRRIASATSIDSCAIWVRPMSTVPSQLCICGLFNIGSSWSLARRGYQYHYDPLPHAAILRVEGPGRLVAYQGHYRIASLGSGRISKAVHVPTFEITSILPLFTEMQSLLRKYITPPKYETAREWHEFELLAIVNAILSIVNTIQTNGHGGTLILIGRACAYDGLLRIKYRLASESNQLRQRFAAFMNLRHQYGDMVWPPQFKEGAPIASEESVRLTGYELTESCRKLAETCALVGGLSGADGATVLCTDMSLLGFGAEILLDRAPQAKVYSVANPYQKDKVEGDSEAFGMRHRSAMRLCAATSNLAVFVVSQDGGVTLVWNDDGDSCYTSDISISNTNMVLA